MLARGDGEVSANRDLSGDLHMKTLFRGFCLVVIAARRPSRRPDKGMASKAAIDADVRAASEKFATQVRGARDLAAKAERCACVSVGSKSRLRLRWGIR